MKLASVIDDVRDSDLGIIRSVLEELGYRVSATTEPSSFRRIAPKAHVQVADYRLTNSPSIRHVRNGAELIGLVAAESKPVPTLFVTNFRGDCAVSLDSLDPRIPVELVAKPPSNDLAAWRAAIAPKLAEVEKAGEASVKFPLGVPVGKVNAQLFHVSHTELLALDEDERDELDLVAAGELATWLRPLWRECDSDWVMVSRLDDILLVVDRGEDIDLPSPQMVQAREYELEAACLIVGRPVHIEEGGGPAHCTPADSDKNWERYPFITLRFSDSDREFHLDTGSPHSYLSLAFARKSGMDVKNTTRKSVVLQLGGLSDIVTVRNLNFSAQIIGPEENHTVQLLIQCVKQWDASPLNTPCRGQRCPGSAGQQCGRRLGLIGRDVLYRVEGTNWIFDPLTWQFYVQPTND